MERRKSNSERLRRRNEKNGNLFVIFHSKIKNDKINQSCIRTKLIQPQQIHGTCGIPLSSFNECIRYCYNDTLVLLQFGDVPIWHGYNNLMLQLATFMILPLYNWMILRFGNIAKQRVSLWNPGVLESRSLGVLES